MTALVPAAMGVFGILWIGLQRYEDHFSLTDDARRIVHIGFAVLAAELLVAIIFGKGPLAPVAEGDEIAFFPPVTGGDP